MSTEKGSENGGEMNGEKRHQTLTQWLMNDFSKTRRKAAMSDQSIGIFGEQLCKNHNVAVENTGESGHFSPLHGERTDRFMTYSVVFIPLEQISINIFHLCGVSNDIHMTSNVE